MPICLSGIHRTIQRCDSTQQWQVLIAYAASYQSPFIRPPRSRLHERATHRRHNHTYIHTGTICVPDAQVASIRDVLNHITPIQRPKLNGPDGKQSLLLLVTPGLARLVRDDSLPVDVAKRILANHQLPTILESVTGVVDAVPSHRAGYSRAEGISYALCNEYETPILLSSTQLRSAANKPGSLTFQLGIRNGTDGQSWEMQLPLSQTIFSTGLTSTLIHRTHDQTSADRAPLLNAEHFLENLTFRVPDYNVRSLDIDHFPLLPLTSCQIVKNSMGNIIRTVGGPPFEGNESEEPASTRLESAVTSYFEALALPPEPVNVWALIIPRDLVSAPEMIDLRNATTAATNHLRDTWSNPSQQNQARRQYSALLLKLLWSGGRLVKVLSGGGGWGKKAGLLSLDPDLEYSTRELRDDFGWSFDFDDAPGDSMETSVEKDLDQALGNSVDEGDGLIFLIGQRQASIDESLSVVSSSALQFRLGTCRPLEDESNSSANEAAPNNNAKIKAWSNSFGFYSETGMAVKLIHNGRLVGKSKLEVPGLDVVARSGD